MLYEIYLFMLFASITVPFIFSIQLLWFQKLLETVINGYIPLNQAGIRTAFPQARRLRFLFVYLFIQTELDCLFKERPAFNLIKLYYQFKLQIQITLTGLFLMLLVVVGGDEWRLAAFQVLAQCHIGVEGQIAIVTLIFPTENA